MKATYGGALPSQTLRELINSDFIKNANVSHVAPASLDLSLSDEIYSISGLVLPKTHEKVSDLLTYMSAVPHSFEKPLMYGQMYLARLNETLALPHEVYGYCNPKSSTGRLDMHVRVLADGVPRFDSVTPKGFAGELWVAIHPKSFSVLLHNGTLLTQLRLFTRDTRFTELDLEIAIAQGLMWHQKEDRLLTYDELVTNDKDGAVVLTALVEKDFCGYHCIAKPEQVIDVAKIASYEATDFFEKVEAENDALRLVRDHFYILSGAERVRIPPTFASEMVPMDERSGDFRSHYAGFLDPGWGFGKTGEGKGRPFTLEIRPFEDLVIRSGQPIAKIKFERMIDIPDIQYDTEASHYLTQTCAKLAKQFR